MPTSIIVRDTIKIRILTPDDAPRLLEIFHADPDIQNKVTWTSGLNTIEAIQNIIQKLTGGDEVLNAITLDDELIGYLGVWKDDGWFGVIHPDDYAFGYFCHPSYRGKGIITDAAIVLMNTVESTVHVKTFSLYIEDSNPASQAVAKRLGFVRTGETYLEPVLGSTERRYVKTSSAN